ncbi:precorrin-3B C(17)-methyltransferase [Anabaena cylindrica FACHB-243]|uniref:Precorrin-3B C17-methyltransferase n=1 Tax=Anabaena cylindrica (strain ATCC 27899 / PCC 7122) TaxID=272123 RepID=K9ZML3_ANACC|nr:MULTISPECIES: precorrin-3B C(17)-methyltransferase [Anabaena]AFZ60478.1 precorrin-3B C17-methyltransferase [Anabaena cylindrica PCC 7122]MBD2416463.1 precorrin-3B C(17)-methyltransferase [Anabaena cylindrica FACHB-243]MBY5284825.1 precorrin-3B C(17)-methyltransferase [Anabaena sp. CCAP 1446/1C]MBY5310391.1 precorrin-3B C(17)-methyltransferase [Anabaena sp. CCAP 1446/1C]MCM2408518.1 precorrin-3B C(17)-methyltransferase [Anabaena sp. CCAP 1446/1C]
MNKRVAPAIVVLSQNSVALGRQIISVLPRAKLYGLANRTSDVDVSFTNFGETLRELFAAGTPLIGICAAGILIRTLAPLLTNKGQEPPVLAVAEDGSAVVPLLGGLSGVNDLARQIAAMLDIQAAITTTGDLRFRTALLSPPAGYHLANPEDAKKFIADLLAGAKVKLEGTASWLSESQLPIDPNGELTIQITENLGTPQPNCLVYHLEKIAAIDSETNEKQRGKLAIIGTGPGASKWMSSEVKEILNAATDLVGYKTYINLIGSLADGKHIHESDNREEEARAKMALDLAAEGKYVVVVSSGDPGIFAMATAVFEVLDRYNKPEWQNIDIQVAPGISAMQATAAAIGAPLGHDFCAISLSDILKPWEIIIQRITAAAQGDFVIAFYNPVSKERTWQLAAAKNILLQYRKPDTPVVLGRNLGRPGQVVKVITIEHLKPTDADMRTLIIVGSSQTRQMQSNHTKWVYTPRRYQT